MLFDDTYKTIAAPATGLFKDRGSKFIAYAFPVTTEGEIREHLDVLRKEHFDARHHCYAWRLGADKQRFRANDDGEPSGTAGRPILGQLHAFDLTNVLVVVVRYFGGTLLGVGGLVQAYKQAAADALGQAQCIELQIMEVYELAFPYTGMNAVMKLLKEQNIQQWAQDFALDCKLQFAVRKSEADVFCAQLHKIEGATVKWRETR